MSSSVATARSSNPAPIQGSLCATDNLIVATLARSLDRPHDDQVRETGIGAFQPDTLDPVWSVWDIPPLAFAMRDEIYAYGRSGLVVVLDGQGRERWRTEVPDDRSEPARQRREQDSPFEADVLAVGNAVYLAAGSEILQLNRSDGRLVNRLRVCGRERGVIGRIAGIGDGQVVATCTARTEWDDELRSGSPLQPAPPLALRRTAPGDLVALDSQLQPRWRLVPPYEGLAYTNRRPVALNDGSIGCAAGEVYTNGEQSYVQLFHGRIFAVEAQTGELRWIQESVGGYPPFDPIAVQDGVVCGSYLTMLSLTDGTVRWAVARDQHGLNPNVAPICDPTKQRLLLMGRYGIQAVSLADGSLSSASTPVAKPLHGIATTPLLLHNNDVYLAMRAAGETRLFSFPLQ